MALVMDGYDPLAMPYGNSPMPFPAGNLANLDYMSVPSAMDDQYSNFGADSEPYMSDDMGFGPPSSLQPSAMMKHRFSGFEDPFAEATLSQFESVAGEEGTGMNRDADQKYLSFSMPQYNFTLLDDSFRRSSVNINAQLHGMFFLAESQWPATPDTPAPPPELTCYRRNLFQITGSITLPRNLRYVFTDDGSRIPIYELELVVSATESVEGNTVKIISVPWKTPTGSDSKPEDKVEREPPSIALDKMSSELDTDFISVPIQWKRLQFRIATANNGRRKELQQHFVLHLKIMAALSTGGRISIAEAHSGAIIVRGRSPRNFAARKDLPLSSSSTARKHLSVSRNSTTSVPQITSAPKVKTPPEEVPQMVLKYDNHDAALSEPLHTPSFTTAMNPPAMLSSLSPEGQTPNPFAFTFTAGIGTQGPESLHFSSDDEGGSPYAQHQPPVQPRSRQSSAKPPTSNPLPSPDIIPPKPRAQTLAGISPTSAPQEVPAQRPRLHSHHTSMTVPSMSSNPVRPDLLHRRSGPLLSPGGESADQLYEYFPLALEDWQPPVDAVFRPHVVHHEIPFPPDARSPIHGRGSTSKRYFSEVA